ncbi:Fasciclin domain family protein [Clavispora lusitaniae]|uniref:FAS1 domain-containing protein n=2 Tax=Clavispora lusitaniae TaxID=36911 RepID=C4Y5Y3_CLAL4|nr:uncharacterized protein CLUG_03567 [Clavispora lusitaniae ATCC 42720]EEQ39439.1 hypothetical protein CLUG_03567 [Clavispora lusitaniae ATCC 42720]KAF7582590.1 Fasciclin domain family protein [Clavispora lusitaniae]OVF11135.1 hypothetical protein A9F13_01g06006 [Clavispora lusitaniae]
MKFTNIAVLLFASVALSKNVMNLENLHAAIDKEEKSKRDAKNVVSVDDLWAAIDKEEGKSKREAKNVQNIEDFFKNHNKRNQDVLSTPGDALLQNILPSMPSVSIFAGYLRDDAEILSGMEAKETFTFLLAPSDDAIATKLGGLKPWEFPKQVKNDDSDDEVIASNIDNFLKAHISSDAAVRAGSSELSTVLLNGKSVIIQSDPATGVYTLQVEGKPIPVSSYRSAGNGVVLIIEDVLSKPQV